MITAATTQCRQVKHKFTVQVYTTNTRGIALGYKNTKQFKLYLLAQYKNYEICTQLFLKPSGLSNKQNLKTIYFLLNNISGNKI